jgi:hypothetical protein
MPRRRQKTRNRRLSDSAIGQLRQAIAVGVPWVTRDDMGGRMELLGLISGCWYGLSHLIDENDDDSIRALWSEFHDEILEQHTRRRPGTRPSAWWRYEAPEPRRTVELIDEDDGEPYEAEESQREYLTRMDLLTPIEKEIFDKYGDIVLARISSGMFGKCDQCWKKARAAAKKIDFNLDAQVLPYNNFWLPSDLIFDCLHREEWSREGIFTVDILA